MAMNNKSGCLLIISGIALTAVLIGIALFSADKEYGITTLVLAIPLFVLTYWYGNRIEKQEETDRLTGCSARANELIAYAKQGDFELVVKGPSISLMLIGLVVLVIGGLFFSGGVDQTGDSFSFDTDLIVLGTVSVLAGLAITFGAVVRLLYPVIVLSSEGIKVPFRDFISWKQINRIEHFDYKIRTSRLKGIEYYLKNKKKIQVPMKNSTEPSEAVYLVSKHLWITKTGLVDNWDDALTEDENLTMREMNQLIMKGLDKEAIENPDSPEVKLIEKAHKIISKQKIRK